MKVIVDQRMAYVRSTKNTHRFEALPADPVDVLYVKKIAFPAGITPKKIKVTISIEE